MREAIWAADNVELTTVGIDIGSSTSHLMFARVHLSRLATGLSSRFVVVERKVALAVADPADAVSARLHHRHRQRSRHSSTHATREAGLDARQGRLRRGDPHRRGAQAQERARHRRSVLGQESGKFVCASAGHHMECQLAAHGSGAVKLSTQRGKTLLNVDIGGGTTKLALIRDGELLATLRHRGRRPADRRGGRQGPDPHRGAGGRDGARASASSLKPGNGLRRTSARGWSRA